MNKSTKEIHARLVGAYGTGGIEAMKREASHLQKEEGDGFIEAIFPLFDETPEEYVDVIKKIKDELVPLPDWYEGWGWS